MAAMRNSDRKTRRRCALRIFSPKVAVPADQKCITEDRDKPRQIATMDGFPSGPGENRACGDKR